MILKILNHPKKISIIAVLLLVVFAGIIFIDIFLKGEPFRPCDDQYYLDIPFRLLAWESITKGEWPLWNPYNSGGVNLLGQPFFFLLYPFYAITYLFGKQNIIYILSLVQVCHIIIALTGMYFLLKKTTKDSIIPFWGSILYAFSHPLLDAFNAGQLLVSYAYLPWIILFLYTLGKRNIYKNILGLSLLLFLLIGGGFPQWTIFAFIIIFLFLIFRYNPLKKGTKGKFLKGLQIFFAAGIVAFLLGAIEFIPFLEQNAQGARLVTSLNSEQTWITPWFLSFRLFIPNLFTENYQYFVHNQKVFLIDNFNSFFGIGAAILSIVGLAILPDKWLKTWKIVFIILFLLALGLPILTHIVFFIFMKSELIYTRIGSFLPFIGVILACAMLKESLAKEQKMIFIIRVFALFALLLIIMLAGFTFFGKAIFNANLKVNIIQKELLGGLLFVLLYLFGFLLFHKKVLGRKVLLILLIVLAVAEINYRSLDKLSTRPAHEYFVKTESEKILDGFLGEDKNNYRVHNTSVRLGEITHHYLGGAYFHYFPNANIFNKFYEVNAYILNMQKDVGQFLTASKGGYFIRMGDLLTCNSLPNLLSMKYIISRQDFNPYNPQPPGGTLDHSKGYKVVKEFTDGPEYKKYNLKILEIGDVPPRFFFPEKIRSGVNRETIFQNVIDAQFDPRKITYFEDNISEKVFDNTNQKVKEIKVASPNQVVLKTYAEKPGVLVANNFWHTWWKVKVNGVSQKLYRVNYNFQAVEIPAGESIVYYYCKAESLEFGKYLSMLGIIIIIILTIFAWQTPE